MTPPPPIRHPTTRTTHSTLPIQTVNPPSLPPSLPPGVPRGGAKLLPQRPGGRLSAAVDHHARRPLCPLPHACNGVLGSVRGVVRCRVLAAASARVGTGVGRGGAVEEGPVGGGQQRAVDGAAGGRGDALPNCCKKTLLLTSVCFVFRVFCCCQIFVFCLALWLACFVFWSCVDSRRVRSMGGDIAVTLCSCRGWKGAREVTDKRLPISVRAYVREGGILCRNTGPKFRAKRSFW